MKLRKNRLVSLLLVLAMVLALVPAVLAAGQVKLRMLYPMDVELEDLFMKLMQEG